MEIQVFQDLAQTVLYVGFYRDQKVIWRFKWFETSRWNFFSLVDLGIEGLYED